MVPTLDKQVDMYFNGIGLQFDAHLREHIGLQLVHQSATGDLPPELIGASQPELTAYKNRMVNDRQVRADFLERVQQLEMQGVERTEIYRAGPIPIEERLGAGIPAAHINEFGYDHPTLVQAMRARYGIPPPGPTKR